MSGAVKSVKKVFKKVAKKAKTIVPMVLGGAALIYTAGAALGAGWAAGGWGAAAGKATSFLGLAPGSTISNVLTGALTQAGYGSALGAATSGIMGGDIAEGAAMGAMGGALSGGIVSGVSGSVSDPIGKAATKFGGGSVSPSATSAPVNTGSTVGPVNTGAATAPATTPSPSPAPTPAPTTPTPSGGMLSHFNNPTVIGHAISGLAQGGFSYLGAQEEAEAARKAEEAAMARQTQGQQHIAGNYATSGRGLVQPNNVQSQDGQRPTPTQRFDPRTYAGQFMYNPSTGQVEFVPNATP